MLDAQYYMNTTCILLYLAVSTRLNCFTTMVRVTDNDYLYGVHREKHITYQTIYLYIHVHIHTHTHTYIYILILLQI